jgi:hypothetical protein
MDLQSIFITVVRQTPVIVNPTITDLEQLRDQRLASTHTDLSARAASSRIESSTIAGADMWSYSNLGEWSSAYRLPSAQRRLEMWGGDSGEWTFRLLAAPALSEETMSIIGE